MKICKNCGHDLYFDPSTNQWHHFTRLFHAHSYPYSDVKCYHGERPNWCGCEKPELEKCEDPECVIHTGHYCEEHQFVKKPKECSECNHELMECDYVAKESLT